MSDQRIGREYLRVSADRSGRQRSPDEQHDDNEKAATGHGITLGEAYREASAVSASRYAKKARDDWARLVADLEHGRFGAQALVLWESSRGSRKVGEWVTLIDLCERAKVTVFVTTHGREYDPANPRDRRSLLEDAVDSEWESSKSRDRIRRSMAANAAVGRPHGAIPYGYRRVYDSRTRQLIAQEPFEPEAQLVRELFDRLHKGHSLAGIARDFAARGIRNRSGTPFQPQHLRDMAMRAAYAALRVHDATGARSRGRKLDGAVQGTWEPLVAPAVYFAVRAKLTAPGRLKARPGAARYLLSNLARCAVCAGPLCVKRRFVGKVLVYQCGPGHVHIDMEDLDQLVEGVVLEFLADADAYETLTSHAGTDQDLMKVRGELGQARAELAELRAATSAGRLSVASLVAIEPGLVERVAKLEARERDLLTPAALRGLIEPGTDARQTWASAEVSTRREVVRLLMTRERLGEIRVGRRPPGGKRNVPTPAEFRVTLERD